MAKPPRRASQQHVVTSQRTEVIQRTGPLPTPEELFRYDELLPGAADRIIAMAEREQAHRTNLEDMAQRADIKHRDELVAAQRENARGTFRSDMIGQTFIKAIRNSPRKNDQPK